MLTCFSAGSSLRPLHLSRILYKSTLFMQNKPNFPKSQMNVKFYNTKDYENKSNWTIGENKPNSNPIKPNLQKAKMNVNSIITKDYRKKDAFIVRINKPNFQNTKNVRKLTYNKGLWQFSNRDYEKTNPNKPNFSYPQRGKTEVRCRFSEVIYLSSAFCFLSSVHGHQPPPTSYLGAGSLCRFTPGVLRKFFNKKVDEAIQVDKAFTKHLKN